MAAMIGSKFVKNENNAAFRSYVYLVIPMNSKLIKKTHDPPPEKPPFLSWLC